MSTQDTRPVVLVTGASGQVGYELVRELAPVARVVAPSRRELDLEQPTSIRDCVRRIRPAAILNAAAYTAVDAAESDAPRAQAVNARAPGVLAEEAARAGALMLHFSTDYVFDGSKGAPYDEGDEPNPLSQYGTTKLEGERAVVAAGGAHIILRTAWVYGSRGRNFFKTMLSLARTRELLRVVNDQQGAPTWSRMIAAGTVHVIRAVGLPRSGGDTIVDDFSGVYHLSAGGCTSWHGFACAILDGDPQKSEHVCRAVDPIPTSEYPTPAVRPAFSVLDNAKIHARFGVLLPSWELQLAMLQSP